MVTGDFMKDDLPSADLYILSFIIHDWDDVKIDHILHKVASSLSPGRIDSINLQSILTSLQ